MEKRRKEHIIVIPKPLREAFEKEMRIVRDPTEGLWPVDRLMLQQGILEQLMIIISPIL